MTWRPDNNTNEDAGPSKQWTKFLDSLKEAPDESKAVVKRHRVAKRDRMSPKPNNAFAEDGGAYIALRRESSPTGRHSPPPQIRYGSRFYQGEDRRWRRDRSSSSSSSGSFSRPRQRFDDQHQESHNTHDAAPVSIDPSKAEDVTLHLSLPTAYDIEDALEEAARLRRIGHFKAAIEIYEQDLGQFLEIKYVMVQYAECLLEAGRISKFSELSMKLPDRLMDSLDLNWVLMKLRPDIHTTFPLDLQGVLDDASKVIHRNWPRLDSTEVQLLTYSLDRVGHNTDWYDLYRHFCDENMIWEFHDLFVSMASKFGPEATWRWFFPRMRNIPSNCLEQLDQDWVGEGTDTSVNFALLEISTTSGLRYLRMRDTKAEALECLEKAGEYAARLRSQDPRNIKSRPYLRWMAAKAMIEECPHRAWTLIEDELGSSSPLVRGFLTPIGVFPDQLWPLYAPFGDEQIRVVGTNYAVINKRLATIAKAAEEISDFLLRTACLKELVLNGAEGTEGIMEKLEGLWEESGHSDSISQMHLYQYLLIQDPSDDDKIRHRILLDGETSTGWAYYARCRVMAALATSERERNHYQKEADDFNNSRTAPYRMREHSVLRERSASRERSRPPMRGFHFPGPHRSSGDREREESPNFLRPSDDQKRNGKSQETSLEKPQPRVTLKRFALKEQEQNEIIRSREREAIGKREDDAIGTAAASSGKMTDLTVTEYGSKNPVTAEHEDEDEDTKSDETEIMRTLVEYGDPEDEDLPRRDSIDILPDGKAELESTHGKEDEGHPHNESNGTWS
ncbi:unnamed protein product [Clonostachys solani]|uniref:Uncharacterized protein n=1 Tax=Clonostachys solani TaxID=160281 RepID=A0A9N9ZFX1_9HYPO|nr:unnamed protein product [Clonostachys solani]